MARRIVTATSSHSRVGVVDGVDRQIEARRVEPIRPRGRSPGAARSASCRSAAAARGDRGGPRRRAAVRDSEATARSAPARPRRPVDPERSPVGDPALELVIEAEPRVRVVRRRRRRRAARRRATRTGGNAHAEHVGSLAIAHERRDQLELRSRRASRARAAASRAPAPSLPPRRITWTSAISAPRCTGDAKIVVAEASRSARSPTCASAARSARGHHDAARRQQVVPVVGQRQVVAARGVPDRGAPRYPRRDRQTSRRAYTLASHRESQRAREPLEIARRLRGERIARRRAPRSSGSRASSRHVAFCANHRSTELLIRRRDLGRARARLERDQIELAVRRPGDADRSAGAAPRSPRARSPACRG